MDLRYALYLIKPPILTGLSRLLQTSQYDKNSNQGVVISKAGNSLL